MRKPKRGRAPETKHEELIKKQWYVTAGQNAFIQRKIDELRLGLPPEEHSKIHESALIRGLLDLWMAFDAQEKEPAEAGDENEKESTHK